MARRSVRTPSGIRRGGPFFAQKHDLYERDWPGGVGPDAGLPLQAPQNSVTADDTFTTSDAATRALVLSRTAADTLTTSSTVARTSTLTRTVSDALTTSDATVGVVTIERTASDTVTAASAVTRAGQFARTVSGTVTISTAANPVVVSSATTAADALVVSDTATRVVTLNRVAYFDFLRASTEAGTNQVSRTASDSLAVSDSVSSGHVNRTASDTVLVSTSVSAPTAGAVMTVRIFVAGEEVTDDVVFSSANFSSFVNGKPGEAYMRVRDLDSTRSFVSGSDWLVMINGEAAWRGFVNQILRVYIAPALNVAEQGLQRFIDLRGADLNLLFSERIVYKKSDPTHVAGTQFPADTHDTVAITELLANWLDLSGDDLDTSSGVTHVGSLDPAVKTRAWSGGWNWGNAMDSIAMLPAAIYYIRPEVGSIKGTLCYVDVDQPTSPFGLSDVYNGTTTKGYREMEIVLDGTSLVNDFYAWGMGFGSASPVFSREQAPTSQDNHGLWQQSIIAGGVYKQGTIDRIADSYVNGSPESKRGGKADRPYVRLTTYDPGLLAGHVVDFSSEVWGYSDSIPVRQLTLTFEAPDVPRYDITLSHEIDAPWGFIDKFLLHVPTIPPPGRPCPPFCPPGTGGGQTTDECQCGITDGFDRTIAANQTTIGVSDAGIPWTVNLGEAASSVEVTPTTGLIMLEPLAATVGIEVVLEPLAVPIGTPGGIVYIDFRLMFTDVPGVEARFDAIAVGVLARFHPGIASVDGNSIQFNTGFTNVFAAYDWEQDAWYDIRLSFGTPSPTLSSAGLTVFKDGVAVVDLDLSGLDFTGFVMDDLSLKIANPFGPDSDFRVQVDELNIYSPTSDSPALNLNKCSAVQFDDFQRTVFPGWGTSQPSGFDWVTTGDFTQVIPGLGVLSPNDSGSALSQARAAADVAGPWEGDFSMLVRFQFPSVPSGVTASSTYILMVADTAGLYSSQVAIEPAQTTGDVTVWSGVGPPVIGTNARSFSRAWVAGDWYYLRWVHGRPSSGTDTVTIWPDGDPEPSTPNVTMDIFAGSLSGPAFELTDIAIHAHGSEDWYISSIDIDYADRPCYYDGTTPVGPVGSVPQSPSGWGCEVPERLSATSYRLSRRFIPNSTLLWVNGLGQRRGIDFFEGSDKRTLTLSDAVASGSQVFVCYFGEVTNA